MKPQQPGWEGIILAFVMIFTVLLGSIYGIAVAFKFAVPWLAILIVSLGITGALYYYYQRRH